MLKAVYTTLREAEYRSLTFIPYWKIPPLAAVVPRQRACKEALQVINQTLDGLITKSKKMVRRSPSSPPSSTPCCSDQATSLPSSSLHTYLSLPLVPCSVTLLLTS